MDKDEVNRYYKMAMIDIEEGLPVKDLEKVIKYFEEQEKYEACAGILKAVNELKGIK
jgi:Asp-tRNA(Asn)/Glu-tRNA(Gln) amidotransferase C subunit